METGRVLQFDRARGYGFVAADDGGEDVFLHASVFDGDTDGLHPGMRVEFRVMAGDRGRKAFAAHLIVDEPDPQDELLLPPQQVPSAPPVPLPQPMMASAPLVAMPPAVQAFPAPASQLTDEEYAPDEEPMCDVLSQAEFGQELTELLLDTDPALTGQQIREVRRSVLEFAGKHGWVDI